MKGGELNTSDFISLKRFILSLKGKTDNILRVTKSSFNNIETTASHRRNNYHEIFFNNVLVTGAFEYSSTSIQLKCREYLVESILHGLDLTTINSTLNVFYKKFNTSVDIRNQISNCCAKIAFIIQQFNIEGKNS